MESAALEVKKIHILRVDPGEDVLVSVRRFLKESGIGQAVVMGGYGTLVSHNLHWVMHNQIPAEYTYAKGERAVEILAMSGLVTGGEPHIHVTLSTWEGAFGGHLEEGCIAYILCEIFLAEVTGATLARKDTEVDVAGMGKGPISRLMFE